MSNLLLILFALVVAPSMIRAADPPVPAKSPKPSQKSVSTGQPSKLKPAQKIAALAALKALNRLKSATEVGVTYSDYGSRLIDVKADVDENLDGIPDGPLKQKLEFAMDAYGDVHTAWGEIIERGYWMLLEMGETGKIVAKYKLDKGDKPAWDWKVKGDGVGNKELEEAVAAKVIPSLIWTVASSALDEAKAIIKKQS